MEYILKKFSRRYRAKKIFMPPLLSLVIAGIFLLLFDVRIIPGADPVYSGIVIFLAILAVTHFALIIIDNRIIRNNENLIRNTFNNMLPLCITNTDNEIILANDAYWEIFGRPDSMGKKIKCHDHRPGDFCRGEKCPLNRILSGIGEYHCESQKSVDGRMRYFLITARPVRDHKNRIAGITESFQEITERRELEMEKEILIRDLRESMKNIKILKGLLPICASCKKVRDDNGYWEQIETYIRDHSEADFTHGICPDCITRLYPDSKKKRSSDN